MANGFTIDSEQHEIEECFNQRLSFETRFFFARVGPSQGIF
jgi:hypothetical protein